MLVFDPAKRISVVDALAHPYLEEGRLRYHSCMCKCCYSAPPAARHYSPDLEPVAPHAFHDGWERKLTSVHQVKGNGRFSGHFFGMFWNLAKNFGLKNWTGDFGDIYIVDIKIWSKLDLLLY